MTPPSTLLDLRCFYSLGETVTLLSLPEKTARVVARRASGEVIEAPLPGVARLAGLRAGTYGIEALDAKGQVLAEEFMTVGTHPGERPVHGFATSFETGDVEPILAWHRALRSTVVQIYDWMATYTEPLGAESGWRDPSNRPVSIEALRGLSSGLHEIGAVAHAYAPVYAVGLDFANHHPDLLLHQEDGQPIRFLDQIVLANPGNAEWQRHFAQSYGAAMDAIGFDGLHVDTYGYPRLARDVRGERVDMRGAYEAFLVRLRSSRPSDLISFNQVNGVPAAARLPENPRFRYCEVWSPNDCWRHFEGLLDRSSGRVGRLGTATPNDLVRGSIACYPTAWTPEASGEERENALRTVLCTEAVSTCLGASALLYGDRSGVLCDPYYPQHVRLSADEANTVLEWRRFTLRCRDLFFEGEDTSWTEFSDVNGSVSVTSVVPVEPEPLGGSVFARVAQGENLLTVGVVDLSGSPNGKWSEPTSRGLVTSVAVRVLVDQPETWRAEAAILGRASGRFTEVAVRETPHRQGRALEIELPLEGGWSVLRLKRDDRSGT